jgi:hypothetical protein
MKETQSKKNLLEMNSKLNNLVYNSNEYINYLHKFFAASDLHKNTFGNYPNFNQ